MRNGIYARYIVFIIGWTLLSVGCSIDIKDIIGQNAKQADTGSQDAASDSGGGNEEATRDHIAIRGTYTDNYGTQYEITDTAWSVQYSGADPVIKDIAEYDNDSRYAITKEPDDAAFNAGLYNREVWTLPSADGSFFLCTIAFGKTSKQEAVEDPAQADPSDPEIGGCGDFPWSKLTPSP